MASQNLTSAKLEGEEEDMEQLKSGLAHVAQKGDEATAEGRAEAQLGVSLSAEASLVAIEPWGPDQVLRDVGACARHFALNGCVVIGQAVPTDCCNTLAEFVDAKLAEARRFVADAGEKESSYVGEVFGRVRCRAQRWDIKLPFEGPVLETVRCLGQSLGGLLTEILGSKALLTEMSCIVSDPGAAQQPVHADTASASEGLMSIFVALQPVTRAMGPTVVCPKTHILGPAEGGRLLRRLCPGVSEANAHPGYQDKALEALGGVQVPCNCGTALLYDARLLHCGGANLPGQHSCDSSAALSTEVENAAVGGARRRMFVCTFVDVRARAAPKGSTCTIRQELRGRVRLHHFLSGEGVTSPK